MKTTLNQIREHSPCSEGWEKLLRSLNKTKADDEPVSIIQILNSNGLDDALWCLRAVKGHDREIRLFAVWCARQVEHLNTDPRVKECNDVSERFANGEATEQELSSARAAAEAAEWAAARDAARAARAAEWDAEWDAARAAWAAARAAEWAAEWDAARAAWAAEWAAEWDAARAAWAAARAAAGDDQEKELRRICQSIGY